MKTLLFPNFMGTGNDFVNDWIISIFFQQEIPNNFHFAVDRKFLAFGFADGLICFEKWTLILGLKMVLLQC